MNEIGMIIKEALPAVPVVVLVLVSWVASKIQTIEVHLAKINGSVIKLDTWTKMHEQVDNERLGSIQHSLDLLRDRLNAYENNHRRGH